MKKIIILFAVILSGCVSESEQPAYRFRVSFQDGSASVTYRISQSEWADLGQGAMVSGFLTEGFSVFEEGELSGPFSIHFLPDSTQIREWHQVLASYAGMPCKFAKPEGRLVNQDGDIIPLVMRGTAFRIGYDRILLAALIDSAASIKADSRVEFWSTNMVLASLEVACPEP